MGDIGEEIGGALDKTWGGEWKETDGGEASILEERKGFKKGWWVKTLIGCGGSPYQLDLLNQPDCTKE